MEKKMQDCAGSRKLYVGIDLGGTNIKAALVQEGGEILAQASCPTALPRSPQAICDDIAVLAAGLLAQTGHSAQEIGGMGVGCPGTVEGASGTVLYSNNLQWHDFAMGPYLTKATGWQVSLGNDANMAALGEASAGCARGAQSAVILTLGTGVGGGVVLDGRMLTGYTGAASEPGHIVVEPDGELCTCGRRGCLEAYASATALIRMTRQAMEAHPESALHALAAAQGGVSGRTAFDAAAGGDAAAQQVVERYIHYLALGVADLINIFFPEVVGLSGGIAKQGENLLAPLRRAVEPMVFGHAFARKHTRIMACTLGYEAGMIGAAVLAKQNAGQKTV